MDITKRKKVLFLIANLEGGGAEKVLLNVAVNLAKLGYLIKIAVWNKKIIYEVPKEIELLSLNLYPGKQFLKKLLIAFSAIFKFTSILKSEKPDVAISFMTSSNIIMIISSLFFLKMRTIISERNTVSEQRKGILGVIIKAAIKSLYNYADLIIAVSKGVADDLIKLGVNEHKISIVYNPIDIDEINRLSHFPLNLPIEIFNKPVILSIGKLEEQKGYPYLLKAFAILRKRFEINLVIVGKGSKEIKLRKMAKKLMIERDVFFLGFQKNPYNILKRSSLFVLASLYEGLPNVLIEALSCGIPVISTDCRSGPREILENGKYGILVRPGNYLELFKAMRDFFCKKIIFDKEMLKKRAEKFSLKNIIPQYIKAIEG